MFVCILGVGSLCVTAQDNTESVSSPETQQVTDSPTEAKQKKGNLFNYYSGSAKKFSSEWSFYGQKYILGIGITRRYEFNPYICWNIVGISYLSGGHNRIEIPLSYSPSISIESRGWEGPVNLGTINVRLLGFRFHSPSYRKFRAYADINIGYTYSYYRLLYTKYKGDIYDKVTTCDPVTGLETVTVIRKTETIQDPATGELKEIPTTPPIYDRKYEYFDNHWFGIDLSAGVQVHKHIAVGYGCTFLLRKHDHDISHWAKLSFLF